VRLWDATVARPRDRTVVTGHLAHAYGAAFSPDGKTVATGSDDKTFRLWDVAAAAPKERYALKKDLVAVYTLAFTPDGKTLAYGGNDTSVRLHDLAHHWERRLPGHPAGVSCLALSADGKRLVSCSLETVKLWDVEAGRAVLAFKGHTKAVGMVAISPDGRRVLSCSGGYKVDKQGRIVYKENLVPVLEDCDARLWDAETGKELHKFDNGQVPVLSVAFSPDGRRLAYGAQDPVARLYDLDGNRPGKVTQFKGSGGPVYWIAFAPDGKMLATVGLDGKVILWDPATGARLREWAFQETTYRAVFAPDSRHLAIPLGTGVVYILRVERRPDLPNVQIIPK
jgi:Tol biopolymer transport system component